MILKRLMALLTVLALLCAGAYAETETAEETDPVVLLFSAVAGTTWEAEKAISEQADEEELSAHREELAAYREMTLGWLKLAMEQDDNVFEDALKETDDGGEIPQSGNGRFSGEYISGEIIGEGTEEERIWSLTEAYDAICGTETGREYLTYMAENGHEGAAEVMRATRDMMLAWMAEIDHEKLLEKNGDYACWLYLADTKIDYPVVYSDDNIFYLHHLFNGQENSCGTLFVDYRALTDFRDPNTVIYGHHMNNGSMLRAAAYYTEPGFYESHPYMIMLGAHEIDIIEVYTGYVTSKYDEGYTIGLSDADEFREYVEKTAGRSDFYCEVVPQPGDRLVTFSTCAYVFEDARYIVIGRITPVWKENVEYQYDWWGMQP